MASETPLFMLLAASVIGAAVMALTFQKAGYNLLVGGLLGVLGGGAGSLLFMGPLNYCTFAAESTPADVIFGVVLIGVGMAIILFPMRWLTLRWRNRKSGSLTSDQASAGTFKSNGLMPYLLLSPTLIILILFLYYPFLDTFRLSTLLTGRSAPRSRFVCVENFTELVNNPEYGYSLVVTFIIAASIVALGMVLSLLIATLAYQPIRGASVYRTMLIWPYAISPVVAGVIFGMMFETDIGIINHITNGLFGVRLDWLKDGTLAVIAVVLTSIWKTMGFNILFYIAGLQNIPNDLREAASIDGANLVQRFFRITIPLLSPITFFLIITNMTYAFFEIFGTIDYLTAGGPLNATSTLIYNIYELQSQTIGLGKAAAQSIILFLLVIALTLIQFRTSERQVTYGA